MRMKKHILYYLFFLVLVAMQVGCNNNDSVPKDDGFTTDTSAYTFVPNPSTDVSPMGHYDPSLTEGDEEERAAKRQLMINAIEASYEAIGALTDIRTNIMSTAGGALSASERNLRSKTIFNLNHLENAICRQVDSTMLESLKLHTSELQSINKSMLEQTGKLKALSSKIENLAKLVQNVTNAVSFCITKGMFKPATPAASSASAVVATLPK